jgi:hypothetical protein
VSYVVAAAQLRVTTDCHPTVPLGKVWIAKSALPPMRCFGPVRRDHLS